MNEKLETLKPRLSPTLSIVREGEDACYLMSSGRELFRLSGGSVPVLLDQMLPLMDGTRTVGELRAALVGRIAPGGVEDLVQALLRQRVIVDAGPEQALSAHEREAFANLLVMLVRSSAEPYRLLGQLRAARVVVLGDLELSREVVLGLSECAIGRIDLLVEELAPERGGSLPAGVHVLPMEDLEAVVPGADLVIGVQDGELNSPRGLRELNRLCLRLGASWLRLQLTLDAEGWIGPLHAPGSACFECLELRLESNLRTRREQKLHMEQVEQGLLPARRLGFAPFQRQLASAMALEVLLLLTGLEPSRLVGRGLLLDMLTHERSMHPVLKHPACLACGKQPEDRLRPWSQEEIRPGRTLLKEPVAK